ncbi:MAG: M12 family metallopeptidase [Anaerolineae bacterium]
MTVKPYQRRWLSYLVGMIALAVVMSALFPARPAIPSDTPAAAPADPASDPLRYEVNLGTQWYTSDITSMYMGRWFTAPMTYTIIDGGEGVGPIAITQGDIALNLNSITTAGSAVNRTSLLWPGGIVPWDFAPNFPAQYRVFDAIAHWEEKTSIRFVQRTPENADQYPNWVRFTPSMGCWSYVGMQGGMQFIGLAAGCSTGSTIHEIGHALGLWHEQSRIDRDDYVTIYFENIIAGMAHNFAKHVTDGQDLGPYDYDSIMHYPRWAFSKNGKDTIVPKIDVEIGQRSTLSQGDIAAIEALYGR